MMFNPAKEVPAPASYSCKGCFYETSYEALRAAIKDCLRSGKKDAVIVLDEIGDVSCTVCKIKDGIAVVYGDGHVEKYKSIQTFYPESSSNLKDAVMVAIVSGRIIQL